MIADIPHGTPRDAGLGIVLLARLSGRPILPTAITTSRRKVLERSWDKTTINLPFGRSSIVIGMPVFVPANADAAEMERKRQEVTASLNAATAEGLPPCGWSANERALGARLPHGLPLRGCGGLSADRTLCRLAHLQGQGGPRRRRERYGVAGAIVPTGR